MFGFNAAALVKKGKWEKLTAVVNKVEKLDVEKCLQIAAACAESSDDGAYNTLITMLNSDNRDCKLAAIKALAKQGRAAAVTQVMYQSKSAGDDGELKQVIANALELLHKAHN